MRVIAGSARGTKLCCPEGETVRPTHDRVKEAVFSMLTGQIRPHSVLDLFAGTGALGIEALSRGAQRAVFVDCSARSLKTVEQNVKKTHLQSRAQLVQSDALAYLSAARERFDLIFLDPPYAEALLPAALALIGKNRLLAAQGIIVCETEGEPPKEAAALFQTIRDKKYGRARILLLKELGL